MHLRKELHCELLSPEFPANHRLFLINHRDIPVATSVFFFTYVGKKFYLEIFGWVKILPRILRLDKNFTYISEQFEHF